MSDGVSKDLCLLTVGVDNNPGGQYQSLIPFVIFRLKYPNYDVNKSKNKNKSLIIIVGPNGHTSPNNVNVAPTVLFCLLLPSFCSYYLM